jgi:hypothetical protein
VAAPSVLVNATLVSVIPTSLAVFYNTYDSPFQATAVRIWKSLVSTGLIFLASLAWGKYVFAMAGDFAVFYVAGHLPLKSIYDLTAIQTFGVNSLAPIGISNYPPFVRPAVFALALRPLAFFPYWPAFFLWAAANVLAYFGTVLLLQRWLKLPTGIVPAFATFLPAIFGIVIGQDIAMFALVVTLAIMLLVSRRDVLGGLLLGLCFYKFNLVLLLPLVLLLHSRWKALFATLTVVMAILVSSSLLVPVDEYLRALRSASAISPKMVFGGLHGTLLLIHLPWLFAPIAVLGIGTSTYFMWRLPLREALCVGITGILLFGYYVTLYDCTLLAIPIAVIWNEVSGRGKLVLLGALHALFLWFLGLAFAQVALELTILGYLFAKSTEIRHLLHDRAARR